MLFRASAAEINRSSASSDVRLKPPEERGFGFFPRATFVNGVGCTKAAELDEPSSWEESVMVLSLVESSELESVS